jgi:hypothetical protein
VLAFGRGQNFFGHIGHGQTAKRPMANPGQISNGQITNYISISIWLAFDRGQNFFGNFGRGQTAKRPTASPGQMANVPTLH